MKRPPIFLFLLFLLLILGGWTRHTQPSRPLRVCLYENPPKIYTDQDGRASGFWPELVRHIAAKEGWQIEWLHGTWDECLQKLTTEEIDILPDMGWTPERSRKYAFSKETVLLSWARLYATKSTQIESILDLEGKTIAGLAGSFDMNGPQGIKNQAASFGLHCQFVERPSYTEVFEALQSGQVDLAVVDGDFGRVNASKYGAIPTPVLIQPTRMLFAFPKEETLTSYLIEHIDADMRVLKAKKGSVYYHALDKYVGAREAEAVGLPKWTRNLLLALGGVLVLLVGVSLAFRVQLRRRTQALRESEVKFRGVIEQATEGFVLVDEKGLVIEWNYSLEKLSGLKASETLGKPIWEVIFQRISPELQRDEHKKQLEIMIRSFLKTGIVPEQFSSMELTLPHPNGKTFYLLSDIFVIKLEKGYMLCSVIRDVTKRKMAEKALQESEERLRTLINSTPDIICFKDGQGRWLEANISDLQLFQLEHVDYKGKKDSELAQHSPFYHDAFSACEESDEKAWEKGKIFRRIEVIPKPDGSVKYYDVIKAPVFEKDGSRKGLVVVGRDITAQKRAEEEIERARVRLEVLHELDADILEARSVAAISSAALAKLSELIPAQRISIVLFDEEKGEALVYAQGILEEKIGQSLHRPIYDIFSDIEELRAGRVIRMDDLDAMDKTGDLLARLREAGIRSVLIFPVRSHGMLLGCLNLGFDQPAAFSEEDIAVGREVADSIAIALEQARLREALEEHTRNLEKSLQELQEIYELSLRLGSSKDVKQVAEEAITVIRSAVQPDVALFYLRENERLELLAYHSGETEFAVSEAQHHYVGQCLCGLTAQAGKSIFSQDITKDRRCTRNECKNAGIRSFAGLPLLADEQVIGVIGLGFLNDRDFAKQRSFLETLANEAAVGLQNALLLEELRRHEVELEKRVAARTVELVQANQELESFSYSVSHDLRAPLRAIDGFSRILEEDYVSQLDDEAKRLIGVVRSNTQRMGQLIDDLLAFSRVGRKAMSLSQIDMANLADSIFYEVTDAVQRERIAFSVQDLPPAWADVSLLRQVFMNLLANAVKFSSTKEMPKIEVGFSLEKGETVYYVRDNGVGFDMNYAPKLFQIFQRLHTQDEFEGTGVGLSIVKRIITRHGGRVWAKAEPGKGATFFFTLPARANHDGSTNH